jgi:peptide-methionine (S)-S-oxide reductase
MSSKAYFGGGCFWCIEAVFNKIKGVSSAISGYSGGKIANPSYEQVCGGGTGHVETVEVTFDPDVVSYEELLSVFFSVHDPTTMDRQGGDVGEQYRSVVFYADEDQKKQAQSFIKNLKVEEIFSQPIVTIVEPLKKFYKAEDYHQQYYEKHPEGAYCQVVISPKLVKLKEKFQHLLQDVA